MKVAVVTLGCDKNTVDSERYLAELADRGAEPTENAEEADVILVNTCGFIDAASSGFSVGSAPRSANSAR